MSNPLKTRADSSEAASLLRMWALVTAVALATVTAVLRTFVQTEPVIEALMASDAPAESRQALRMMWHGMTAIFWTYPLVLVLLRNRSASVTRPVLGCLALLNGSQAVLYAVTGLWVVRGPLSVPEWALPAAVAVLAWLARPARSPGAPATRPRRGRGRLVLLWVALVNAVFNAVFHTVEGTLMSWPAELLASDTATGPKLTLYAMWLFSCVLFCAVAVTMARSLRTSSAACRFLLRYLAVLVAALGVSWAGAIAFGAGPDLPPIGPVALAIQAVLAALSAPAQEE
ncbi:hypothetical protein SAMN02982929_04178 [Saccharopolyspora kobensis]|uniref:Uncharacterized protein n=1 Tax=Saccharopolyspora kobensis TaxID=146035 RepID=A0A1H6DBZ5_9PSEU|nr:hypothetical protein [Saccharopolyspora kobensis]SEG82997.1 hypothetical protein SAMN02982929_04178 [Saccharopolyspora kobensis]SFE27574.1 hypothetical protein SAMN05216506_11095 [Saccharopolyspora kobensis]